MSLPRILFVGCGAMGSAIVGRLDKKSFEISVLKPHAPSAFLKSHIDFCHHNAQDLTGEYACIVLAVKPQMAAQICAEITPYLNAHPLIISIMAGTTTARINGFFNAPNRPVIRVMPNLPVSIGAGVSAGFANTHVNARHKALADHIFKDTGELIWLEQESQIDAATAIAGSGSAYFFLTVEALIHAGVAAGLDEVSAEKFARQTLLGAGLLMKEHPYISASEYRNQVTSQGGTTEAAIDVLLTQKQDLPKLYQEAVRAAIKRAQSLAKL